MAGNRRSWMRFLAAVLLSVLLSTQLSCASDVALVSSIDVVVYHDVHAFAAIEHSAVLKRWINWGNSNLPLDFANDILHLVAEFINKVGKDDEGEAVTWVNAKVELKDADVECQVFSAAYFLEMGLLKTAIMSTKRTWADLASMRDKLDEDTFSAAIDCVAGLTRLDQVAGTDPEKQLIVSEIRGLVMNGNSASIVSSAPWHAGDNVLIWAATAGEVSVVEFLMTAPGFDVNAWGLTAGLSALHCAVELDVHPSILRLLLTAPEINVNLHDLRGWTPLHAAVFVENGDAIKELLNAPEIDVNAYSDGKHRLTPLHLAVHRGVETEIVELLLKDPRINVNAEDDVRRTPLDYAHESRNRPLTELLEHRAHQDSDDDSPGDRQSATR